MGTTDIFFGSLFVILMTAIFIFLCSRDSAKQDIDLAAQEQELKKKQAKLDRIYWFIAEIERISQAKTKAIHSGDMTTYRDLCDEKDKLDSLYKLENPN